MKYDVQDTIAATASAVGGAARGVVRVTGPAVIDCVAPFWSAGRCDLTSIQCARCLDGNWIIQSKTPTTPPRMLRCDLYLWPTERSYTRQPTVEIHTLGSPPLIARILAQVCDQGARLAGPGEFTLRAFLAGRLDLPQAEAVLGVIDAAGAIELNSALRQLAGGLSHPLNQLRDRLLNVLADVEAGLDFVDEAIEFITNAQVRAALTESNAHLQSIRDQIHSRHEHSPTPRVLLRGQTNVGKSTLWNALIRRDAAIVSDVAGTTRDYLEASLALPSGELVTLVDTAGVDDALSTDIDRRSQDIGQQVAAQADHIVLCLDGSRSLQRWEYDHLRLAAQHGWTIVVNKIDADTTEFLRSLPNASSLVRQPNHAWQLTIARGGDGDRRCTILPISAATANGLPLLCEHIAAKLSDCLTQETSIIGSTATRCKSCLAKALQSTTRAIDLSQHEGGQELIAAEIRETLASLAEVVGDVYTDDILDRVFSRFCIGK